MDHEYDCVQPNCIARQISCHMSGTDKDALQCEHGNGVSGVNLIEVQVHILYIYNSFVQYVPEYACWSSYDEQIFYHTVRTATEIKIYTYTLPGH